jgi:hypothetical protein
MVATWKFARFTRFCNAWVNAKIEAILRSILNVRNNELKSNFGNKGLQEIIREVNMPCRVNLLPIVVIALGLMCKVVYAPPEGVTNARCLRALERMGANSVSDWLKPRFKELEEQGLPVAAAARLMGIPEKYLHEAMDGSRKNLGTDRTRTIEKFLDSFPDAAPTAQSPVLDQAIEWIKKDAKFDNRPLRDQKKVVYNWAPEVPPIDEVLKSQTDTVDKAAKYFLTDLKAVNRGFGMDLEGKLGNHTYSADAIDHRERFFTTHFKEPPKNSVDTKVYVNIPFASLKGELPGIIEKAESGGAHALKFNGVSRFNMVDKVVVYFTDPHDAMKFSRQVAMDLHNRGITGGPVPFAYQVGSSGTSPVSIARDPPGRTTSWRGKVADALATAYTSIPPGPNQKTLILRYLESQGIDTTYWLPTDLVQQYRSDLGQLREGSF